MKFRLEISCDNAAFGDDDLERCAEIGRILHAAGRNIEDGRLFVPLYDSNGNLVGRAEIER